MTLPTSDSFEARLAIVNARRADIRARYNELSDQIRQLKGEREINDADRKTLIQEYCKTHTAQEAVKHFQSTDGYIERVLKEEITDAPLVL